MAPRANKLIPGFVLLSATFLTGIAGAAMWLLDLRYAIPTPRPKELASVSIGSHPRLPKPIAVLVGSIKKPVLLHFFSPDCPCSRFNMDHIRGLLRRYGSAVRVVVVTSHGNPEQIAQEFEVAGIHPGCVPDSTGEIAAAFGVYSTPQAVVIDPTGALAYRGNYNTARFCTNTETEYARIALDQLVSKRTQHSFPASATTSYGCPIVSGPTTAFRYCRIKTSK